MTIGVDAQPAIRMEEMITHTESPSAREATSIGARKPLWEVTPYERPRLGRAVSIFLHYSFSPPFIIVITPTFSLLHPCPIPYTALRYDAKKARILPMFRACSLHDLCCRHDMAQLYTNASLLCGDSLKLGQRLHLCTALCQLSIMTICLSHSLVCYTTCHHCFDVN